MRSNLRSQKGFTILETLVAAGVSGALLAAALPNLSTALSASRLQAGLRSTAQHVRLARATAVGKNLQSRVVVSENGATLTTQVLRNGTWTSSGIPLVFADGTRVSSVSPSASALTFTSQGTTSGAVTITLRTAAGDSRSLTVSLLGAVEAS
ncbi:MAG: GspH/FimT family pseudopilin [Deltaproteobacteria bacterium]|nr:GspH/FimT family pseudopilin [Deltaproteobacteria bacterium]